MIKFYSVVFTNKLGQEEEQITVGTFRQVEDWAAWQASSWGCTYLITYLATERLASEKLIKNLCNY